MSYLISKYKKTKDPIIPLENNLFSFLMAVGITCSGKKYKLVWKQIEALSVTSFMLKQNTDTKLKNKLGGSKDKITTAIGIRPFHLIAENMQLWNKGKVYKEDD